VTCASAAGHGSFDLAHDRTGTLEVGWHVQISRSLGRRGMSPRFPSWFVVVALIVLGGCATRPINPPITQANLETGYTLQTRQQHFKSQENLVVLAFSGGGTRAAAFSYGVLEFLRRTEVMGPKGNKVRLLDAVSMITGVSGGSFTALAYGLYGEKLFGDYEQRFLKRDVQGELIARLLNPGYWGDLSSTGWGRSELAAQLYDEILFNGATFGDLDRGDGPFIVASATDIASGGRVPFNQNVFNVLCSDLNAIRLSRAAAASSAVPVVLSPITINNYGGTCGNVIPSWATAFIQSANPPRPAARATRELRDMQPYLDSKQHPYIHLVDGGVSDNVGMRGVLDALELLEALHDAGVPTPLDRVRRIIVFVVNSLSSPRTDWDESESPPGTFNILLKAAGVPIDHYSYEAVELLKDISARWDKERRIRVLAQCSTNKDSPVCAAVRPPNAEVYAINVSFAALPDKTERDYLNQQPTSFVLPAEAVDRLRAAAGAIILASPEFQRLLKDVGATVIAEPSFSGAGAPTH
jgi:NTE family protein